MKFKKMTTLLLVFASSVIFAQDTIVALPVKKEPLTRKEDLDSIKSTFVHDKIASCIDSLWMNEMVSLDLYDNLTTDIANIDIDQKVDFELPTELLKERLKAMDDKSPFNIEYNIGLENVIKSFLKNRKKGFERLMGISQFYFPIFEESLAAHNIPLEIKYLSVVESALNPRAVSRVGATGLWQFMYQTGKQYDLTINSYVDDRIDPIKASNAATQYMKKMYAMFGDWDLVLASYNSGPGNVSKAIRRSGGKQNYWNIRNYLPKETQGYLPAFLATMYIFEYHKEHGIKPQKPVANHFATDTVMIKKAITFKQISELLDVTIAEIQFFNPSFKRDEIPSIKGEHHFLRLPVDKIAVFTSNEDKIYAFIKYESDKREKPYQTSIASKTIKEKKLDPNLKYHKVKKGDSLLGISTEYGISLVELKKWNNLKSDYAPLGKSLKIIVSDVVANSDKKPETNAEANSKNEPTPVKENTALVVNPVKTYKEEKVITYKDVIKYHKVKNGDNLSEIASKYNVSLTEIKKWNNLSGTNIGVGKSLKIIKNEKVVTTIRKEIKVDKKATETLVANKEEKENKSDFYEVQKGDNLFSIAKKFNVSLEDLKKWNNLNDLNIDQGSKLALINKGKAQATESTEVSEHIVEKGENLLSISKKYNVSVEEIKDWNKIQDNTVLLGSKLIVAKSNNASDSPQEQSNKQNITAKDREAVKLYYVKKGDSLLSISRKYPGVSISDLKKWNGIKNEAIKPGMKLKING